MLVALTREPSASLDAGERAHRAREPIDLETARRQHRAYRETLAACGARVVHLPPIDDMPDAVFVEDVAVVLDELAILLPMGVPSREGEPSRIAGELTRWRDVVRLHEGTHAEGGDVLRLGRTLYAGRSGRTDEAGIAGIAAVVGEVGYRVEAVDLRGCLHLESAVTALDDETVLLNPDWIDPRSFAARAITVAPEEPWAANAVRAGSRVLLQSGVPRTAERVAAAGFDVRTVEITELAKAEGSLTCLSLLFEAPEPASPEPI